MRTALFALVVVALVVTTADAQKDKDKVPQKVLAKLKPWIDRLKTSTPPEVKESKPGEYVRTKNVASDLKLVAEPSDHADKPYKARLMWTAMDQETKI